MTYLVRHTARWSGFAGAPGYTNFYHEISGTIADAVQSGHDAVRHFFADLATVLPDAVSVLVDPNYAVIADDTGDLSTEGVVGTPSGAVEGSNANGYSAQVGMGVDWVTGVFLAGRKFHGRTYLVPLAGVFDVNGAPTTGAIGTVDAATIWITAATQQFVVWHRPVGGAGGSSEAIIAAIVRPRSYLLRSRSK